LTESKRHLLKMCIDSHTYKVRLSAVAFRLANCPSRYFSMSMYKATGVIGYNLLSQVVSKCL